VVEVVFRHDLPSRARMSSLANVGSPAIGEITP
jgi:hypothetical protein